jgi:dihydroflavonol-4-reductase
MRYAVTGGTGFLGANLIRGLLAAGHEVVALIRKPNALIEGLDLDVHSVALHSEDTGHLDALARPLRGCDGLFHLAGIFDPSPGGEARMRAVHVAATRALCAAAERAGVPRIVLCSSSITVGYGSMDAPGDEETPLDVNASYGRSGALRAYHDTKLEAERIVAEAPGIAGVIVNPDFIIGPHDVKPTSGQLVVSMARRHIPFYPKGGKCFQTAADCAQGHILAMERGRPGRRYLLGSHNLSYRSFMTKIAKIVGRAPPRFALPGVVTAGAGLVGRVGSVFDAHRFAGLNGHVLHAMQSERYRSDDRAQNELGLRPGPIEPGIAAAFQWFSDRGYC